MKWAVYVARMGEFIYIYKISRKNMKGRYTSGKPRRRLEYDIKMDLK